MAAILEVEHLSKHFGALAAVDDLSFSVSQGEILGIAGPNGAGKTALFDVITGQSRATSGMISFDGQQIQSLSANAICQLGIARTFQVAAILPSQTVLGTILAGLHFGKSRHWFARLGFSSDEVAQAQALAEELELGDKLGTQTNLLSVYERKRLMIAAALATNPRILMLDEVVAGLTETEGWQLVEHVENVKSTGVAIVLVEHVMSVLMRVSDRVMIMHQGSKIFEGSPEDAVADPEVIRLYLGSSGVAAGVGPGGADA